jgi:K+-sensing histidine kinase KdpD
VGEASVSVRIVDDGPGIPQAELVGITGDEEPTQLTHGTGFGLWLVRSVVDDYAGSIDYDPRPEGGSIVTVELPAATDRRTPADEPADRGR